MKRAFEDVSGFPEEDRELVRLLIQAARDEIHADYDKAANDQMADSRYRAFLLHIENNLTDPLLNVERAKEAANLGGVATYAAQFKRIVGFRPMDYIEHHRINLAKKIIRHTSERARICDIAFAVGYEDQRRLSNIYKKRIGRLPREESKADEEATRVLLDQLRSSASDLTISLDPKLAEGTSEIGNSCGHESGMIPIFWTKVCKLNRNEVFDFLVQNIRAFDLRLFNFILARAKIESRKSRTRGVDLYETALDAVKAIELAQRKELIDEKVLCYAHLANNRRLKFDLKGARETFDLIDKIIPRNPKPATILNVRFFKALLLWWEEDIESATKEIEDLLPSVRANGSNELLARVLLLAGELFDCSGHPDRALPMFEETLTYTKFIEDPYVVLSAHYNLSYLHAKLSNVDRADELFVKVQRLEKETTNSSEIYVVLLKATILRAKGELREAESAFLEAKEGFETLGLDIYATIPALELALLYLESNDTARAFSMAISIIPYLSDHSAHKEAISALAILEEISKTERISKRIVRQALHHVELMRKNPSGILS